MWPKNHRKKEIQGSIWWTTRRGQAASSGWIFNKTTTGKGAQVVGRSREKSMVSWPRRGHHFRILAWKEGHQGHQRWGDRLVAQRMSNTFSRGWWWAPKMDNYMGSFNLQIQLNPPFSLVYCMLFIIFMLIEWIELVIMPTSLMGALCVFLVNFETKSKVLMSTWQPNSWKNKGEDL